MTTQHDLNAIAQDLNLCDLGIAFTKGKVRARYIKHRADCFAAIREQNKADGLDEMTIDEIMAGLEL